MPTRRTGERTSGWLMLPSPACHGEQLGQGDVQYVEKGECLLTCALPPVLSLSLLVGGDCHVDSRGQPHHGQLTAQSKFGQAAWFLDAHQLGGVTPQHIRQGEELTLCGSEKAALPGADEV